VGGEIIYGIEEKKDGKPKSMEAAIFPRADNRVENPATHRGDHSPIFQEGLLYAAKRQ
jgi:hypothetical protein